MEALDELTVDRELRSYPCHDSTAMFPLAWHYGIGGMDLGLHAMDVYTKMPRLAMHGDNKSHKIPSSAYDIARNHSKLASLAYEEPGKARKTFAADHKLNLVGGAAIRTIWGDNDNVYLLQDP